MNLHELADQIQKLRNTDQPPQRTEEWYKYRNGLLTATICGKFSIPRHN